MRQDENITELLTRGVVNILPDEKALREKLEKGDKLNVYLGIDPTATRIHIGHAVALRKLQQFAVLGHNVTFLIGDFTALIGDTSDKNDERPVLTSDQIEENFQSYKRQAEKILDFTTVTVRHNSEWLSKLSFKEIVELLQHFSVGDFVSRELIRDRLQAGKRVGLHETIYPVMQGYDSYFMDTDVQIGGGDQTFNMLAGRTLQKDIRNKESYILVTGYLEGTDGRKMSKSWGNAIWLEDEPREVYGKIMSLKDELIPNYLEVATSLNMNEVNELASRASSEPMEVKKILAYQITKELNSEDSAEEAQAYFEETFQRGGVSEHVTEINVDTKTSNVVDLLVDTGLVPSKSEAKRLVRDGAVDFDNQTINDPTQELTVLENGSIIKVGKKTIAKLVSK